MKAIRPTLPSTAIPAKSATSAHPVQSPVATVIDSRDLFRHGSTICIDHAGQRYILRVTRENKLILTK